MDILSVVNKTELALRGAEIPENAKLLVAISGGPDSVALLHILCGFVAKKNLAAAHLHHGIRGNAADSDAAFVQAFCTEWGIPLVLEYADAPRISAEQSMTLEEAARAARYAFLERAREKTQAAYILTAHHMDDQAETVLMHMLRGSGLKGLCGMQTSSGRLLRPLLTVRRAELMAYLEEHGLDYCVDETNAQDIYLRNRIRLQLLPYMATYNPNIVQALSNMALLLSEDESYISLQAQQALAYARLAPGAYSREKLRELAPPVKSRALRLAFDEAGALYDMSKARLTQAETLLTARTGAGFLLPRGKRAWVSYDTLYIGEQALERPEEFETAFIWPGETHTPDGVFLTEECGHLSKGEGAFVAYMDADALPQALVARRRRPGDRFHPFGAPGTRKLKEYLIDKKIPRELRERPVLAAGTEVLFFPGGSVSQKACVCEGTRRIIRVEFRPY